MALVVNTNVTSNVVQATLSKANDDVYKSITRLSTGSRINKAADDAAGLSIAKRFDSQARASLIAKDNTQHGINLLQIAEGDLEVIQDNLQRIRDLAVQAANGTYSTEEKSMLANEVKVRLKEIDRIATVSKFSTINLLDGSTTSMLVLQVGTDSGKDNQLDIKDALIKATATALNAKLTADFVDESFSTSNKANAFLDVIDNTIDTVSASRSKIGAYQNRLESTLESLDVRYQNMSASLSTIEDTDVARETTVYTKAQILQSVSSSLLAQANSAPSVVLDLI
ncbi:MAG: hypothetical protein MJ180_06170 [Candidatus Gastranaerophilales bacterium]|nr:hypothetical protein [Candidatus Gastranaerophilales bacterium]